MQCPNLSFDGFCHAFDGAHPQLEVGMHRIFDQHSEVRATQRVSKSLNSEWTDRGSCPNPKGGHARFQGSFNMRGGGDFRHGLQARLALRLHQPIKPHCATTFEAVGSCARFPKPCTQKAHVVMGGKLPCGVQDLRSGFCTAWSRNDHGFAITSREGVFAL